MSILTRYILRELVTPTLLGFAFYTLIIVMKNLFDFAEMIIKRSLPLVTVLELLALSLPHIIVLTIPMSLLFGILIAIGRLSSDSEIIAIRAAGVSTSRIYVPVLYFSLAIFLLNLYLMNFVLPRGNTALQNLKSELFTLSIEKELKPRVFYDEFENRVIYVNDVDPADQSWKGVFISDTTELTKQRIITADRGRFSMVPESKEVWIDLQGVQSHFFDEKRPDRYDLNRNAAQRFLLLDKFSQNQIEVTKSLRELTFRELRNFIRHSRDPIDRRLARVEIHKKFSIPFACLAFGIIGLPLGITNRRGGKSSGFTLSVTIILIYYVMLTNGEDLARSGAVIPAIAMWTPNLILVAFGLYLLRRANRDSGYRGATWAERIRERFLRYRATKRHEVVEERGSLLSKMDIAFPNILDRYVLKEFGKVLGLVLVSTAVLFVIVDYTELAHDISQNGITMDVVASYYRYYSLQVLNWVLPLSVLFTTLVTFGLLSKNNEVTALKASGVSLYRIALPVVAVAGLISVLSYFLLDFVLPYSNQRMNELRDRIQGTQIAQTFSVQQRQWLFGKGRDLFNFLSYDNRRQVLSEVQVFEFDPNFRLKRRVWAEEARFDGTGWVFVNGWIRDFSDSGESSYTPVMSPMKMRYPERPEYFAHDVKRPNQMTYRELRRYLASLRQAGYRADDLAVDLYEKTSWPFISLVMALIALPFSFRLGKGGSMHGIGIAILLAMIYWMLFGVFTKFGEVGSLPALLAAWSANILFIIAAVYLFLRVET